MIAMKRLKRQKTLLKVLQADFRTCTCYLTCMWINDRCIFLRILHGCNLKVEKIFTFAFLNLDICIYKEYNPKSCTMGCSQAVRHQTLTLALRWFESSHPSQDKSEVHLIEFRAFLFISITKIILSCEKTGVF